MGLLSYTQIGKSFQTKNNHLTPTNWGRTATNWGRIATYLGRNTLTYIRNIRNIVVLVWNAWTWTVCLIGVDGDRVATKCCSTGKERSREELLEELLVLFVLWGSFGGIVCDLDGQTSAWAQHLTMWVFWLTWLYSRLPRDFFCRSFSVLTISNIILGHSALSVPRLLLTCSHS